MTPLHVHPEDEVVQVVEGALTLFVNDEPVQLEAGDAFAAPRAIPHALVVESREVRYLSATVARSAARYEDFLRAVAVPAEASSASWEESGDASRLAAIAEPNGIEVLGPPGYAPGRGLRTGSGGHQLERRPSASQPAVAAPASYALWRNSSRVLRGSREPRTSS
jgi:cupin domain